MPSRSLRRSNRNAAAAFLGCIDGAAVGYWPGSAASPHTYVVVIDKLKFGPLPALLHKGESIVWDNRDMLRHSATAVDHSFDADLKPGAKVTIVLKATVDPVRLPLSSRHARCAAGEVSQ